MPEFHFFFNDQDKIELIEFCLNKLKLSIIPDIDYDAPTYLVIKDIESYKKQIKKTKGF